MMQLLPALKETISAAPTRYWYNTIHWYNLTSVNVPFRSDVTSTLKPLGKPQKVVLDEEIVQECHRLGLGVGQSCHAVYRVAKGATTLFSNKYGRTTKRNSHTVSYKVGEEYHFDSIQLFLLLGEAIYAVVESFQLVDTDHASQIDCAHQLGRVIIPVKKSGCICVVPVDSIRYKCVFITIESHSFCCIPPNSLLFGSFYSHYVYVSLYLPCYH